MAHGPCLLVQSRAALDGYGLRVDTMLKRSQQVGSVPTARDGKILEAVEDGPRNFEMYGAILRTEVKMERG